MGNQNADQSKYTLSYEAYFTYIGHLSSKRALKIAICAIIISILVLGAAVYYSQKQLDSPIKIDPNQFHELLQSVKNNK